MLDGSQAKAVSDEMLLHPDGTIDIARAEEMSKTCRASDDEELSHSASVLPSGENHTSTSPCPVCPRLDARVATIASGGGTPAIVDELAVGVTTCVPEVAVADAVFEAAMAIGCVAMPHNM